MMCDHCPASVQRAVQSVDGVMSVAVSQTAGPATVTGTASVSLLIAAIARAGYTASEFGCTTFPNVLRLRIEGMMSDPYEWKRQPQLLQELTVLKSTLMNALRLSEGSLFPPCCSMPSQLLAGFSAFIVGDVAGSLACQLLSRCMPRVPNMVRSIFLEDENTDQRLLCT